MAPKFVLVKQNHPQKLFLWFQLQNENVIFLMAALKVIVAYRKVTKKKNLHVDAPLTSPQDAVWYFKKWMGEVKLEDSTSIKKN